MSPMQVAVLQTIVSGALLGTLFGTIALGVTIKWGLLGIADFFHVSLTLLGAYLTYSLVTVAGFHPFTTLLVTVPAFFLVGMGLQWIFVRLEVKLFTSLLVTFGLFVVTESVITLLWSADTLTLRPELPEWLTAAIALPWPFQQIRVLPPDLLALISATLLIGTSAWALRATRLGRGLHAMHQDPGIAEVFGVRLTRTAVLVAGFAAGTAAIAGMVVALKMPLNPHLPLHWLGVVVVATLLGGLGRPLGALLAAVFMMIVQNLWSLFFSPSWAPVIAFGFLFLYLLLQPLLAGRSLRSLGGT
jgi:branched-chain amino acid transport system permease protein